MSVLIKTMYLLDSSVLFQPFLFACQTDFCLLFFCFCCQKLKEAQSNKIEFQFRLSPFYSKSCYYPFLLSKHLQLEYPIPNSIKIHKISIVLTLKQLSKLIVATTNIVLRRFTTFKTTETGKIANCKQVDQLIKRQTDSGPISITYITSRIDQSPRLSTECIGRQHI